MTQSKLDPLQSYHPVHLRIYVFHLELGIRSTRQLIIFSLKEKLRKSYILLTKVKGQFDKKVHGWLYNAYFAPHVLFLAARFKTWAILNLYTVWTVHYSTTLLHTSKRCTDMMTTFLDASWVITTTWRASIFQKRFKNIFWYFSKFP